MNSFIDRPDWHARYDDSYPEVMRVAFRGGLTAQEYEAERIAFLRQQGEATGIRKYSFDAARVSDSLQSIHGRLSPLLKIPPILKRPIDECATRTLRRMFRGSAYCGLVNGILGRSLGVDRDFRYRTQPVQVIIGHDGADIRSLAGFAHELGHCMFETLFPRSGRFEFYSELFAICLETRVVATYLTDATERQAWLDYQTQVDELNFALAELERLDGIDAEVTAQLPKFDRSLLLLRETLFTRPGYQEFYAEGSARRAKIFARLATSGVD